MIYLICMICLMWLMCGMLDNFSTLFPTIFSPKREVLFSRGSCSRIQWLRKTSSAVRPQENNPTFQRYELGRPKSGWSFIESKLVNHCKLGLENWKHWPWLYSAYAGPNSLRIPLELAEIIQENSKLPIFGDIFGIQMCITSSKNRISRSRWKL